MADLGGFQRFPLKPPFAATVTSHEHRLTHVFVARERALTLACYKYLRTPSAYIRRDYRSSMDFHLSTHVNFSAFARVHIINWVWLHNSRDMLPPLQNPRSATVQAGLTLRYPTHTTLYAGWQVFIHLEQLVERFLEEYLRCSFSRNMCTSCIDQRAAAFCLAEKPTYLPVIRAT